MRDAETGLEVLLLRRSEHARFVPGAYVFPGGGVDAADAAPDVTARVSGLSAEHAAERLGLREARPPALAYVVAAVRETFEESGLLVGVRRETSGGPRPVTRGVVSALRADLLAGRIGFAQVLRSLRMLIAGDELAYLAHWITPESSPRRYDTRFFAARVVVDPAHSTVAATPDAREVTHALWTTPAAALAARAAGAISMILPTVKTLEQLVSFSDTRAALAAMASAVVATNLPASTPEGFATRPGKARLAEP